MGIGTSFASESAGDIQTSDNTTLISTDTSQEDISQSADFDNQEMVENNQETQSDKNEILGVNDGEETLKDGELSFTSLRDSIDAARGTLELNNNYTRQNFKPNYIHINKNLVIEGNGHSLDAQNIGNIFSLGPDGKVTFNNIIFRNAAFHAVYSSTACSADFNGCIFENNHYNSKSNKDIEGGIVYMSSTFTGSFKNVVFRNNGAKYNSGGAIYLKNGGNVSFENVTFFNNSAAQHGGAIYFMESTTISFENVTFINNRAAKNGGAIYAANILSGNFENVRFINNSAVNLGYNSGGGAIYFFKSFSGSFSNVNFTGNSYNGDSYYSGGGAIYFNDASSASFDNVKFTNNTSLKDGGAIYFYNDYSGNMSYCEFIGNNAKGTYGGAINLYNSFSGNLYQVNFTRNHAFSRGGAFHTQFQSGNRLSSGSFRYVKFIRNDVSSLYGGAVDIMRGNISFINVDFINNTASSGAGLYYSGLYKTSMINLTFIGNTAKSSDGGGMCVYAYEDVYFVNAQFFNNSARSGGAAYFSNNKVTFVNSTFENNTASISGGAVYAYTTVDFENCTFTKNNAKTSVLYYYYTDGDVHICNSKFFDNYCGALKIPGGYDFYIENSSFYRNHNARALISNGHVIIVNSSFENNEAGAIWMDSNNIEIIGSNFTNNSADIGGAILLNSSGDYYGTEIDMYVMKLDGVVFTNNTAPYGSAIWNVNYQINATNSKFLTNKANTTEFAVDYDKFRFTVQLKFTGGNNYLNAIYAENDNMTFKNVTYFNYKGIVNSDDETPVNNFNVTNYGVKFEVYSAENELYETFIRNTTGVTLKFPYKIPVIYQIRAIHDDDGYYVAAESTYTYTWGDFDELQQLIIDHDGSLTLERNFTYIVGQDTITDGIFINKTITIDGNGFTINALNHSRIFKLEADTIRLVNIRFADSHVLDGSFIYGNVNGTEIDNCEFSNKGSDLYNLTGGAIYLCGNGNSISNSKFSNVSANNGGAIYLEGIDNTISKSLFINVFAVNGGAIYLNSTNTQITDSNFTKSHATSGGAVYVCWDDAKSGITNCIFDDNSADNDGGAITWSGKEGTLTDSLFTSNFIRFNRALGGGAVFWKGSEGIIRNNNFTNNSALAGDSGFSDNLFRNIYGGAILASGNYTKIQKCNFINNSAQNGGAVAIMYLGDVPLTSDNFEEGKITDSFGITAEDCLFINNFAQYGGALTIGAINGRVINCKFYNNTAYVGGAINLLGMGNIVEKSVFDANIAHIGGALVSGIKESKISGIDNMIMTSNFTNNRADSAGAVLWLSERGSIVENTLFSSNKLVDCYESYAKAFSKAYSFNIAEFDYYHIDSYVRVTSSLQSSDYAGAIYWTGENGLIEAIKLMNNTATYGGALYLKSPTLTVSRTNFTKNSATHGGAVYWDVRGGKIANSEFDLNDAVQGGAIFFNNVRGLVDSSKFINNTAVHGGALYVKDNYNHITGSEFRYNKADFGSAIYLCEDKILNITSTTLLDNQASATSIIADVNVSGNDITVTVEFKGSDNFINAVYALSHSCLLNDVTYWGENGETNSDDVTPILDTLEAGQNITVELYNSNFNLVTYVNVTDLHGIATIPISSVKNGRYLAIISHKEDNYYTQITTNKILETDMLDSPISLTAEDINFKENATIEVSLPIGAEGNITFEIDGVNITTEALNNSRVSIEVPNLKGGMHDLTVYYPGSGKYVSNSRSTKFVVNPLNSTVTITADSEHYYGSPVSVNVTVNPEGCGGEVILTIEGTYGIILNITGSSTIQTSISNLDVGVYNITAYCVGDANYSASKNSTVFTVKPIGLTAQVSATNITVEQKPMFTISVPDGFKGKVNITVDGISKVYNVSGIANIEFEHLEAGEKTASLKFFADKNYNGVNLTANFTVSKSNTYSDDKITVTIADVTYPQMAVANIEMSNAINGTVKIVIGNQTFTGNVKDGIGNVELKNLSAGSKIAAIEFVSEDESVTLTASVGFIVNRTSSTTEILFEGFDVIINIPENATGNVTVYVNGAEKVLNTKNGELRWKNALIGGSNSVVAVYGGDVNFMESKDSKNITASKISSSINVSSEGSEYGAVAVVTVEVPENQTGFAAITVKNRNYTAEIKDGKAKFNITGLDAGSYDVSARYLGNDIYNASEDTTTLNIAKAALKAEFTGLDTVEGENSRFVISVPDDFKGKVNITVDGKSYSGTPDTLISMDPLTKGAKKATAMFWDDENYKNLNLTTTFNVAVNSANPVIMSIKSDDMTRGFNSPYDYQAAFLDSDGNALANKRVVFTVNGKSYNVTTNKDGIAQLSASKLAVGSYTIKSFNPATGEEASNKLVIVKRLTANKDITVDYYSGKYFKVKVWGDNGKIAPEGEFVSMTMGKKSYVCRVDSAGYAKLKINLLPKTYKVITEYKGYKVTNKIVVKQTLKLVKKTISIKKSAKKIVLKATLKSSKGKAIAGKKITFKFMGKKYTAKTNKKGLAQVTIKKNVIKKLKKGKKYAYTATYLKNTLKGKVNVKK